MRLIVGGRIIEDNDYYNRVHQMLDFLTPAERRTNTMVERVGKFTKTDRILGSTQEGQALHSSL